MAATCVGGASVLNAMRFTMPLSNHGRKEGEQMPKFEQELTDAEVVQVIDRALTKVIPTEQQWTKGVMARDLNEKHVDVFSPDACLFCMAGSLYKSALDLKLITARVTYHKMCFLFWHDFIGEESDHCVDADYDIHSMSDYNDDSATSYQDVVRLLRRLRDFYQHKADNAHLN